VETWPGTASFAATISSSGPRYCVLQWITRTIAPPTSACKIAASSLEALLALHPAAFEHLAQRLLREAGFLRAPVTGRTGDGGIDGLGIYQLSLLSFPVFFQCKRYRGSVGSSAVRDFRGAMAGRGDKGLLITTGTFTADSRAEASRDGAPLIDLIDGDRLCDLLRTYQLGVTTTVREVEDVTVNTDFWLFDMTRGEGRRDTTFNLA